MSKGKEMVKFEATDYPVLLGDAETKELIEANLGQDFNQFDLEHISIPTGGSTVWSVEELGGTTTTPTLEGIIVAHQKCRVYWRDPGTSDEVPDCSSDDAISGVGDPGGICAECPYAQFGSKGADKKGQACKLMRRLFLIEKGSYLPAVVSLPPTSLKAYRAYLVRITNAGMPYWRMVSQITLEKHTTPAVHARAVFNVARKEDGEPAILSPEQGENMRQIGVAIKTAIERSGARLVVGGYPQEDKT